MLEGYKNVLFKEIIMANYLLVLLLSTCFSINAHKFDGKRSTLEDNCLYTDGDGGLDDTNSHTAQNRGHFQEPYPAFPTPPRIHRTGNYQHTLPEGYNQRNQQRHAQRAAEQAAAEERSARRQADAQAVIERRRAEREANDVFMPARETVVSLNRSGVWPRRTRHMANARARTFPTHSPIPEYVQVPEATQAALEFMALAQRPPLANDEMLRLFADVAATLTADNNENQYPPTITPTDT